MSAATVKTPEPSMEEILASIRRIISDDQDAARSEGAAGSMPPARPMAGSDEDVLDLAELPRAEAPPPARTPPSAAKMLEIDVPDLSFHEAPAAPSSAPTPPAEVLHLVPPSPALAPPPAPPLPAEHRGPAAADLSGPDEDEDDGLVSDEVTASIGHAFNRLSHTVLERNARTLEDLVKDMLKPMLKAWLDDNLPPLVERLVRTEIERVARGHR